MKYLKFFEAYNEYLYDRGYLEECLVDVEYKVIEANIDYFEIYIPVNQSNGDNVKDIVLDAVEIEKKNKELILTAIEKIEIRYPDVLCDINDEGGFLYVWFNFSEVGFNTFKPMNFSKSHDSYLSESSEYLNLDDDIVLVFSDLVDNGFKVKREDDLNEIAILKWHREPFKWNEVSDKLELYEEHINDKYDKVRISYLIEGYYLNDNKKTHYWYPYDPFLEVWSLEAKGGAINVDREDIYLYSIGIFTEFL